MILEYFGEDGDFERCGVCDNCLHPVKAPAPARMKPQPVPPSEFRHGEPVRVPKFGRGLVEAASADRVIVSFPNGETRQFLRPYVSRVDRATSTNAPEKLST
jgi:ATP-dependent DNA helicase RecQ